MLPSSPQRQDGTHDSVQDAKTALRLYMLKSKASPTVNETDPKGYPGNQTMAGKYLYLNGL
jgi:hypothetical protein